MTLQLIEGCNTASTNALFNLDGWNGAINLVAGGGRFGGQCFQGSSNAFFEKAFPTAATVVCGFAFKLNGTAANDLLVMRTAVGATTVACLRFDGTHLTVRTATGGAGILVATGTTTIPSAVWYYAELKVHQAGASGTCELPPQRCRRRDRVDDR